MKALVALALLVVILTILNFVTTPVTMNNSDVVSVTIGKTSISATIADTDDKRVRGLSGRAELQPNEGMLFVFDEPGMHGFWMKDMNFPIDIMWIDEEFMIIGITENIATTTYPTLFYPPEPVKYVIEVSAGFVELHSLQSDLRIDVQVLKPD